MSVDLYVENVIRYAKLVVVRLLGGASYWSYGVEQIAATCQQNGTGFAAVPGDDTPDLDLAQRGTLPSDAIHRLWQYLVHGGPANADNFLQYAAFLIGREADRVEPAPLMTAGLYWPDTDALDLDVLQGFWKKNAPIAAITFYRALIQSGNIEPIDAIVAALQKRGLNPLPLYIQSLKDTVSAGVLRKTFSDAPPAVILNTTGFAVSLLAQIVSKRLSTQQVVRCCRLYLPPQPRALGPPAIGGWSRARYCYERRFARG